MQSFVVFMTLLAFPTARIYSCPVQPKACTSCQTDDIKLINLDHSGIIKNITLDVSTISNGCQSLVASCLTEAGWNTYAQLNDEENVDVQDESSETIQVPMLCVDGFWQYSGKEVLNVITFGCGSG